MMNVTLIFPDVMVVIQRLDDDWGGADPCSNPAPILLHRKGKSAKIWPAMGCQEMGIPTTPGCVILLG